MTLPFKLSAQTVGAQKAFREFVSQYGRSEGERIFLAKAEERGKGKTIREKVNFTYRTGARLDA